MMQHPPHQGIPPNPVQRALINRQNQVRRSTSGSGSQALRPRSSQASSNHSPQLQPTPPSQNISPTSMKAPLNLGKGGIMSPSVDLKAQQQQQPPPPHESHPYPHPQQPPSRLSIPATRPSLQTMTPSTGDGSRSSEMGSAPGTSHPNFYPSPFQAHIEQLGKLSRPLLSVFLYRAMFVLD